MNSSKMIGSFPKVLNFNWLFFKPQPLHLLTQRLVGSPCSLGNNFLSSLTKPSIRILALNSTFLFQIGKTGPWRREEKDANSPIDQIKVDDPFLTTTPLSHRPTHFVQHKIECRVVGT